MQVVSLEPEIRWIPQWSVAKQVTISEGGDNNRHDQLTSKSFSMSRERFFHPVFTSPMFFYPCVWCAVPPSCPWPERWPEGCCPSVRRWRATFRHGRRQTALLLHPRQERTVLTGNAGFWRKMEKFRRGTTKRHFKSCSGPGLSRSKHRYIVCIL